MATTYFRTHTWQSIRHYGILLCCFLSLLSTGGFAQKSDSFYVQQSDNGWLLKHKVKKGETVFSIAKRYHVPPVMLSNTNAIGLRDSLRTKSIWVPLGAYNIKTDGGITTSEMKPLYHKLSAGESLKTIAKYSLTTQRKILDWNHITDKDVYEGQVLLVGWMYYDATGTYNNQPSEIEPPTPPLRNSAAPLKTPAPEATEPQPARPKKKDTVYVVDGVRKEPTPTSADSEDSLQEAEKSEAAILYEEQTVNETFVNKEKGTAVFFNTSNNNPDVYFAFHNTAPKGTIIKVKNPGNGNEIFVKVLSRIPTTGLYHNAIIGISKNAKAALGGINDKLWCELTYRR